MSLANPSPICSLLRSVKPVGSEWNSREQPDRAERGPLLSKERHERQTGERGINMEQNLLIVSILGAQIQKKILELYVEKKPWITLVIKLISYLIKLINDFIERCNRSAFAFRM